MLVKLELAQSIADAGLAPARPFREPAFVPACVVEAWTEIAAVLLQVFAREELERVWATIHRLDFNRAASSKPDYSLLAFASDRSGPLIASNHALASSFSNNPFIMPEQREQRTTLLQYLRHDPTMQAMIRAIGERLKNRATLCPDSDAAKQALLERIRAGIAKANERREGRPAS